ncbi:hypothetical protein ACH3XX_07125 [Streptomyces scabiei]|uniref:hypothetical protein n=1 Tax=Streptomyces scabiei TaxID=1930 RepID=UPI0037A38F32
MTSQFGIKRVSDAVVSEEEREEFSPFRAAYETIRDSDGPEDLFSVIVQIDKQFGDWHLTERLLDHFWEEMNKAPRDRSDW